MLPNPWPRPLQHGSISFTSLCWELLSTHYFLLTYTYDNSYLYTKIEFELDLFLCRYYLCFFRKDTYTKADVSKFKRLIEVSGHEHWLVGDQWVCDWPNDKTALEQNIILLFTKYCLASIAIFAIGRIGHS